MSRYQDALGLTCLTYEERSWLENIFEKFASRPGCWSEPDFTAFLTLSFSEPLKSLVRESGSIVHRLTLRVGSYPYHQNPAKDLDLGTLRTAIIILLRKDEEEVSATDGDEEEIELVARLQARYLRLIFQSLAQIPDLDLNQKGDTGDNDVIEALRIISKRRFLRHPVKPKIGVRGPPLPSPSSLPSSHAQMLEGNVSKADLQKLIGLLIGSQLCCDGNDQEQAAGSPSKELKKDINCVLRAFSFDQEDKCGWQEFNRVMAKQDPELQTTMTRILEPFIISPSTIDEEAFRSLSRTEATELLDDSCTNV